MRLPILFLTFILCGCASTSGDDSLLPVGDNRQAYVILPDNFVIDVAADSYVTLNPAVQDFQLYPSESEARKILEKEPGAEHWRVYILEGKFAELVRNCGRGRNCLDVPARVVDWVE